MKLCPLCGECTVYIIIRNILKSKLNSLMFATDLFGKFRNDHKW